MNKNVLIIGLLVFAIAFLIPPWEYTSYFSDALASALGGSASTETSFRPIWVGGEITEHGDVVARDAEIKQGLWFGILGGIAFATIVLANIIEGDTKSQPSA